MVQVDIDDDLEVMQMPGMFDTNASSGKRPKDDNKDGNEAVKQKERASRSALLAARPGLGADVTFSKVRHSTTARHVPQDAIRYDSELCHRYSPWFVVTPNPMSFQPVLYRLRIGRGFYSGLPTHTVLYSNKIKLYGRLYYAVDSSTEIV